MLLNLETYTNHKGDDTMWKVEEIIDLGESCTHKFERIEDAVKLAIDIAYNYDAAELENENVRFYTNNQVSADGDPYPYDGTWNVEKKARGRERL